MHAAGLCVYILDLSLLQFSDVGCCPFILKRKREQVALLLLSYGCLVTINVLWVFLTVPWLGDNTHFFYVSENRRLEPSLLTEAIRTKIPYANPYTLHCKRNLYLVKKCDLATEFNIRYIFSGYVSKCLLFGQIGTCGFLSLFYNDYRARGTDKKIFCSRRPTGSKVQYNYRRVNINLTNLDA